MWSPVNSTAALPSMSSVFYVSAVFSRWHPFHATFLSSDFSPKLPSSCIVVHIFLRSFILLPSTLFLLVILRTRCPHKLAVSVDVFIVCWHNCKCIYVICMLLFKCIHKNVYMSLCQCVGILCLYAYMYTSPHTPSSYFHLVLVHRSLNIVCISDDLLSVIRLYNQH